MELDVITPQELSVEDIMVECAQETQDYDQGGIQQHQTAVTRMVHMNQPTEDSGSETQDQCLTMDSEAVSGYTRVSAGNTTSQIQKEKKIHVYEQLG